MFCIFHMRTILRSILVLKNGGEEGKMTHTDFKEMQVACMVDQAGNVGNTTKNIECQPIERLALMIAELEVVKQKLIRLYDGAYDIEWGDDGGSGSEEGQ